MMISRSLPCLVIFLLIAEGVHAQNAYLTHLNVPRYLKAGEAFPLTMRARNAGGPAYNFFQVSWSLDDGTLHVMDQPVGGSGIIGNNSSYLEVDHTIPFSPPAGEHQLKVWITVLNDTDHSNDTLTFHFTALAEWAPKVVLLEARTETWCPVCPPANIVTDQLLTDPRYAIVKFHLSDGMEFPDGVSYYEQYQANFTPASVIEMGEYTDYAANAAHNQWPLEMEDRSEGVSPVHITMQSDLDAVSRLLTITIGATFTHALAGPFLFNVYLAENHIPGPQQNAPPDYIHHGVMRAMLGGASGTSGMIPDLPVAGTTYTHTYTYTIPEDLKMQDLYAVGMVEHRPGGTSRNTLNAVTSLHVPVGIDEASSATVSAHPNPFDRSIALQVPHMQGAATVTLLSMDGRIVFQKGVVFDVNGSVKLEVDELPAAPYLLQISNGRSIATRRIVRASR